MSQTHAEMESKYLREEDIGKWMARRFDIADTLEKEGLYWEEVADSIDQRIATRHEWISTIEADIEWLEEQRATAQSRLTEISDALDRLGLTPEDTDTD